MTAQDMLVAQLMLTAFILMLPALLGCYFWCQAKQFPGKMFVLPTSPSKPVFVFYRRGLSRVGAALTLPFLVNVLAIIFWSRPSFHNLDHTALWLLFAWPAGMYSFYGLHVALKHLGRDELQINVADGTFRHLTGLPGFSKPRTGSVSSLGHLELKDGIPVLGGRRGYWTVRFHKTARPHQSSAVPLLTMLGGFEDRQEAEMLREQLRLSLEHHRLIFPVSTMEKEGKIFVYSPGAQQQSGLAALDANVLNEHIEQTQPDSSIERHPSLV